jgi:hypothetical protein
VGRQRVSARAEGGRALKQWAYCLALIVLSSSGPKRFAVATNQGVVWDSRTALGCSNSAPTETRHNELTEFLAGIDLILAGIATSLPPLRPTRRPRS